MTNNPDDEIKRHSEEANNKHNKIRQFLKDNLLPAGITDTAVVMITRVPAGSYNISMINTELMDDEILVGLDIAHHKAMNKLLTQYGK